MHHDAIIIDMPLNLVRTTITLPIDIHLALREEALKQRKSLNSLLLEKITSPLKFNRDGFRVKTFNLGVKGDLSREKLYADRFRQKNSRVS